MNTIRETYPLLFLLVAALLLGPSAPGNAEEAEETKACCLKHEVGDDDPSAETLRADLGRGDSGGSASWTRNPFVSGVIGFVVLLLGALVRWRH